MKRKKQSILLGILVIFIIILIYSSVKIILWYQDNQRTNKVIEQLNKTTKKIEKEEDDTTEYFCNNVCLAHKFLEVDIKSLKEKNDEVIGWLKVENTNIDYPVVKHKNNSYYLNHSFDKTYNEAGWVFADYRNNINELDQNTIIYAHGRVDGTMFGSLKNLLDKNYLEENKNIVVKFSTENYNYLLEGFSIYHIETTEDYTYTTFSDEDFDKFLEKVVSRSAYPLDVPVNNRDKIITLSTCYNNTEKVVLHARLIKKQKRK